MEIIEFLKANWSDIFMIIVGAFALLVYWLQNRKKVSEYASLVVLQIDELQEQVREISGFIIDGKLNATAFYESHLLIESNYWEQSKHYFARKMDPKSFNTINCFYKYIAAIQEQQLLMKNLQKNFFFVTQNVLATAESNFITLAIQNCSSVDENQSNQSVNNNLFWQFIRKPQNKFIDAINQNILTQYIPVQIKISLEKILNQYSMLEVSGTDGYRLLKKISKRRF